MTTQRIMTSADAAAARKAGALSLIALMLGVVCAHTPF